MNFPASTLVSKTSWAVRGVKIQHPRGVPRKPIPCPATTRVNRNNQVHPAPGMKSLPSPSTANRGSGHMISDNQSPMTQNAAFVETRQALSVLELRLHLPTV